MIMRRWKLMQQSSGWPLGPVGSFALVTAGPFVLWGAIRGFFWTIQAVSHLVGGL